MKRKNIQDALQIAVALLITSGMASAMAPPKAIETTKSEVHVHKSKQVPKPSNSYVKAPKKAVKTKKAVLPKKVNKPAPAALKPLTAYTGSHSDWMAAAGIAKSDYFYVDYIMKMESGWCATKWQGQVVCPDTYYPTKSLTDGWVGYGLCQSTPGIKMSGTGKDYLTNPVTQLRWCSAHANSSHGGWYGSYQYWLAHRNW